MASIAARPGPYKAGRLALRARLVSEARRVFRSSARLGADEAWFEGELTSSEEFGALLETLWPAVSPTALVRDLLSSRSQLRATRRGAVLRRRSGSCSCAPGSATVSATAWSIDDLALLDEATFLTGGRSRTYGHIVVDEAQDLTPMQFRMIARRAPSGSITVLGDLAQATGPWTYADWDEIRTHLPETAPPHHDELTLGYRAPGRVLDFASRLLPVAAPGVSPTSSIRPGRTDPAVRSVEPGALATAALTEARSLSREHALVAVVVPEELVPEFTRLARRDGEVGMLERDAMSRPITIVPAPAAKGLEFDAVVVVEPSAIAGDDRRGLRLLYVAMTRPIQHLSVVHARPSPLRSSAERSAFLYDRATWQWTWTARSL